MENTNWNHFRKMYRSLALRGKPHNNPVTFADNQLPSNHLFPKQKDLLLFIRR
ncbi:MAG: hypothetical protein J1F32_01620 [Erysipelotrichales bacterium]|nr:hypothetical protein [Erysipelotrichales bacterium]